MAEVQEPAAAAAEPSMEEILASIRKIISDDAPPAPEANGADADIIELTQVVEEDGSVVDATPTPPPASPEAAMPEPTPPSPPREPVAPAAAEPLVAEPAISVSASAISALASTVEIERLAAIPQGDGMTLGNGSRTLEDMAVELMRPLLKDWLDKNLPTTVERLVQKEIERISKRAKE